MNQIVVGFSYLALMIMAHLNSALSRAEVPGFNRTLGAIRALAYDFNLA